MQPWHVARTLHGTEVRKMPRQLDCCKRHRNQWHKWSSPWHRNDDGTRDPQEARGRDDGKLGLGALRTLHGTWRWHWEHTLDGTGETTHNDPRIQEEQSLQ